MVLRQAQTWAALHTLVAVVVVTIGTALVPAALLFPPARRAVLVVAVLAGLVITQQAPVLMLLQMVWLLERIQALAVVAVQETKVLAATAVLVLLFFGILPHTQSQLVAG
jgi:hypothetical protein